MRGNNFLSFFLSSRSTVGGGEMRSPRGSAKGYDRGMSSKRRTRWAVKKTHKTRRIILATVEWSKLIAGN